MYHTQRWTLDKIRQRLELISPKVYIGASPLPPSRYKELESPLVAPPVAMDVDDSPWEVIHPNDYWGRPGMDFILRTAFTVPEDWDGAAPVAFYLPLSENGDYCHPETLLYVDGSPFAACDRRHNEILLKPEWLDGRSHRLALHGWTGTGG